MSTPPKGISALQGREEVKTFSVWAPRAAERVEIVLTTDGRRVPMARGEGGWWTANVPEVI